MESSYGAVDQDGTVPVNGTFTSQTDSETDLIERPNKTKSTLKGYPYSVFFILSNEFCERFSYYGMRAILVLYLTKYLSFSASQATSIFHAFVMFCYGTPLIGAVIADGYLGRYRTILYLSCIYFVGNLVLSLTALPPPEWFGASIGLFLIACGTGGIKASVAPFGADQFVPGQEKWRNSFFSAFYFMINLGSTISILLTPILRADVQCFGNDCYPLAFGVPAILMFLSIILFLLGRNMYIMVPPAGNIVGKTFKCIYYGAVGKFKRSKYEEPRTHWLYYADDKFDSRFIEDVKCLLRVLTMFLPLPLFWALSDQQGSRWTLQAEHMDGGMGFLGTLKPDQMQALNPILVIALIPLFDKVIYPLLDKHKIPNRPLQRMVVGLYISALAFVCAGLVQMKIDNAEAVKVGSREAGVTFLNTLPCPVQIESPVFKGEIREFEKNDFLVIPMGLASVNVTTECNGNQHTLDSSFTLGDASAYRMIIYMDAEDKLHIGQFLDKRDKPQHGNAAVSVFYSGAENVTLTLISSAVKTNEVSSNAGTHFNLIPYMTTDFKDLEPVNYKFYLAQTLDEELVDTGLTQSLGSGGVYTILIPSNLTETGIHVYVDVAQNTVSIFWLIPQYFFITVGEVLFSVSGLSFAYSQAPESLKSVVQAVWLLTVSFGDLVVIIVANIRAIPSQMVEFYIFALLMFLDTVIFMIMSMFYTYKPNSLDYHELSEEPIEIDMTGNASKRSPSSEEHPLHLRNIKRKDSL